MIKFRRNCKRGEGRSQEAKGAQRQRNSLPCENFATKRAPLRKWASSAKPFHSQEPPSTKSRSCYKTGLPLRNHFSAQAPLAKIFAVAKHSSGTRVPFRSPNTHFAVVKRAAKSSKASFCNPSTLCKTLPWHTGAISQPYTPISQLQNGL